MNALRAIGRVALLVIVAVPLLIAFAFWATANAAREIWRADIVPAWHRGRR